MQLAGKYERDGSKPSHQVYAEKTASTLGEEKQPLHNCAAKQKTACSSGDAKQKTACPQLHQRRKPLVASEGDLTPTNPLHQIGDEPSIPAMHLEVQYMFMWISINWTL